MRNNRAFQSVKGSQNVIGGAGGSGAGGDMMGEPTTDEPDITPQPTRPTKPAVISTRAVETTVKPVPSRALPAIQTTTIKSKLTTTFYLGELLQLQRQRAPQQKLLRRQRPWNCLRAIPLRQKVRWQLMDL